MSLLVVGTVALDSVKTPFGEVDEALGGSATYFATAASFFTKTRLVAVIGDDFPKYHLEFLKERGIDLSGIQSNSGKTFRWKGEYGYQLNEAKTLETHLNVLTSFKPELSEDYRKSEMVFLGNIDPTLQQEVLGQVKNPKLIACDTMNFWIDGKKDELMETLKRVDIVIINDGEARELSGQFNLVQAARKILSLGPKTLIIKRGEYGVLMFNHKTIFAAPAFPLESVFDPTGAGDSFAGGFMGHLTASGDLSEAGIRQAVVFGSVMASFNVESFSLDRLKKLTRNEIDDRYKAFRRLTHFDDLENIGRA